MVKILPVKEANKIEELCFEINIIYETKVSVFSMSDNEETLGFGFYDRNNGEIFNIFSIKKEFEAFVTPNILKAILNDLYLLNIERVFCATTQINEHLEFAGFFLDKGIYTINLYQK